MLTRVRCALFFVLVPLILLPAVLDSWPRGIPVPASAADMLASLGIVLKNNILRWPDALVYFATDTRALLPRGTHWPVVGAVVTGLLCWLLSMVLCTSDAMKSNGGSRFAGLKVMAWTAFTAVIVLKMLWWWGRKSLEYSAVQENWVFMILIWLGRMINMCYTVVRHEWAYESWQVALAYIFGVGLCEEGIKLIPSLTCRDVGTAAGRAWLGFCSGVGFGVAEAVLYSRMHYDGDSPLLIYLVRYVSLVGFHGLFTALCALNLHRDAGARGIVYAVAPSVIIHGLYDHACYLQSDRLRMLYMGVLLVWFMAALLRHAKRERTNVLGTDPFWGSMPSPNIRPARFGLLSPRALWRRTRWELGDLRWRIAHRR